jgi:uracil-DNA glycosylase family 4
MLSDSMENLYKDALRNLREFNSEQSTFSTAWNYKQFEPSNLAPYEQASETKIEQSTEAQVVTEKVKILDSLSKFGEEKISQMDKKSLLFPGGEVQVKDSGNKGTIEEAKHLSLDLLLQEMKSILGQALVEQRFIASPIESKEIKVLFVSDSFITTVPEEVDQSVKQLMTCFDRSTSELFLRMIKAMGLDDNSFLLSAIKFDQLGEEIDYFETLKSEVLFFKPKLIITLGAQATNTVLKLKSRLKDIHGQFYDLKIKSDTSEETFEVMPLFSPTLLQTAPNMKKTAWKDMQKAMSKLEL